MFFIRARRMQRHGETRYIASVQKSEAISALLAQSSSIRIQRVWHCQTRTEGDISGKKDIYLIQSRGSKPLAKRVLGNL
jgi:hypothetical protein